MIFFYLLETVTSYTAAAINHLVFVSKRVCQQPAPTDTVHCSVKVQRNFRQVSQSQEAGN